jgi:hypothetical protein
VRRFVKGLVAAVPVASWALLIPTAAYGAIAGGNEGPGGTVTVGASDGGSSNGAFPGSTAGDQGNGPNGGASGPGTNPWVCTYTQLVLNDIGGFAPGGPTPGSWYTVTCANRLTGANVTQTEWIPDQSAAGPPPVDPHTLALQAENSLQLPAPTTHLNPSGASIVNLPTWLWIDAAIWHPQSVSASAGPVSATAVATPVSVSWSMGDGGGLTCDGPGTPFLPAQPTSGQSTGCAYTYARTSAGQPSSDGNPDDGAFDVTATVTWSVSWTAQGATGGGALPTLFTSTSTPVRVEQVESINETAAATASGAAL